MAAKTRHAGLTADERSEIRSTVLETRELIENDLYRQLERYGVYEDERVDLEHLGHLDAYDRETRQTIDAAIDRELKATEDDYERSVKNYVREATKTYLNRLVALKAIEVRGLVTETLVDRPQYGNRSKMLRTVDEVAGELTDQPDGGQGSALDLAYTELTDEIGVIFEESEYTAINLDFTVREEVIDQLNAIDESVWESDEAMGWVYQYFGEREREEIDDRIDDENYKVQDTDVATKTQLFTPRYIVEWMVDNSLGRLWLEMKGDETNISDEDQCFYLAPLEESLIDREVKDVRDIKVLDPACGSGHMLFYAFDVLYEMYLEEGDVAEKYIPREILKNNLYGIDIDPGAAQLAALALYVKAKSEEPSVEIEQINIISADAVLVNGKKKQEVLARTDTDLEERVLEQVWTSFEHIREWGSLVRIEERIEEIIEEEREEIESLQATGQARFSGDGEITTQSSFVSSKGEESWEEVKDRLLSQVSELAEEALEHNDPIEEMFAGEVEKSVRLLDVFIGEYSVVVSNPPYLGSGKMENTLKQYVKDNYTGSRDLYTAFIERCRELASDDDYVTMVTPESFMFLYSYRGLRKTLVSECQIIEGAHLSGHSFYGGDRPFTIPFVLRNRDPSDFAQSRFYRMTHEQERFARYEDKINGLAEISNVHRQGEADPDVYTVDQSTFLDIGRTPFVYWFGSEILDLFRENPNLGEVATVKHGLRTGDDDRFVRKYWEPQPDVLEEDYVPFQKSGTDAPYFDIPTDFLFWGEDGEEVCEYSGSDSSNKGFFFDDGLTFRSYGNYFVARRKSIETVFSHKAHFVSSDNHSHDVLTGVLSSSLVRFIMNGINPGLGFEVGDGKRIPIKKTIQYKDEIQELVTTAIEKRKTLSSLTEESYDYSGEMFYEMTNEEVINLIYRESLLQADIEYIHGMIDQIVFDEFEIPQDVREKVYTNLPANLANVPQITNEGQIDLADRGIDEDVDSRELSEEDYQSLITEIDGKSGDELREIAEEAEVSPYTIAEIRHRHDLYTRDEKRSAAGRLLSHYLGCIFGRWDSIEGIGDNRDGILLFDQLFDNNVADSIRECIKDSCDNPYEKESAIEDLLNKGVTDWLKSNFFRYHHCKEYRRRGERNPIYWHLESEKGTFSCFVYYHAIDADTFPKLRGQYIDTKLDTLQNRLEAIETELESVDGDRARELRSEKEEVQIEIDDITDFRDRVDDLIDEGFEPDFEAGIWENIQQVDEHDLLAVPLDKL